MSDNSVVEVRCTVPFERINECLSAAFTDAKGGKFSSTEELLDAVTPLLKAEELLNDCPWERVGKSTRKQAFRSYLETTNVVVDRGKSGVYVGEAHASASQAKKMISTLQVGMQLTQEQINMLQALAPKPKS